MAISNIIRPGRHFLQIPGPTNVPDRVLRAMDYPTIDHRGPDFAELGLRVLDRIKLIFKTSEPVIIFQLQERVLGRLHLLTLYLLGIIS